MRYVRTAAPCWKVLALAAVALLAGLGCHESHRQRGTLQLALTGEIRSLDPVRVGDSASGLVAGQIFEGLVQFDNSLSIRPALAESWTVSLDGTLWTFTLRDGVRFHDDPAFPGGVGRAVAAADVKYSFERVVNPKSLSIGWWIFNGRVVGADAYREELLAAEREGRAPAVSGVIGFRVLDERTFQIELTHPFAPFLYLLAMSYTWVVPREALELYGEDFSRHPVGTGPFVLEEWSPGQRVRLARNPHYWEVDERGRQLPHLDSVEVRMLRDSLVAFLEFERGNLDVTGIPPEMWPKVMTGERTLAEPYTKYQLLSCPSLTVQYFGFLMTDAPLGAHKLLRQAFNYAVDRQGIVDHVLNGRGIPARGVLPPGIPGYNPELKGYDYDPSRARELLAEAGYPGGEGLPEIVLQLNSGGTENEDIAEVVQQQLADIGVRVSLRLIAWPQHLDSIDRGLASFFRLGWVADYPDPENFLALLYSKNVAPAGPNATRFENEEFDRLYREALASGDEAERLRLYQQAERIVVDQAPWLFLFHGEVYRLEQPYVRGYPVNPMDLNILKHVWFEE